MGSQREGKTGKWPGGMAAGAALGASTGLGVAPPQSPPAPAAPGTPQGGGPGAVPPGEGHCSHGKGPEEGLGAAVPFEGAARTHSGDQGRCQLSRGHRLRKRPLGGPVIQGESSATLILGSFHLNCCKEQFFHDKQIASVPQQPWGGQCHPLPPRGPESSSTQGSARGRCGGAGMGCERCPSTSRATGESSPGATGTSSRLNVCLK